MTTSYRDSGNFDKKPPLTGRRGYYLNMYLIPAAGYPVDFIRQHVPVPQLHADGLGGFDRAGGEVVVGNDHGFLTTVHHLPGVDLLNGGVSDLRRVPLALERPAEAVASGDDVNTLVPGALRDVDLLIAQIVQQRRTETLELGALHFVDPLQDRLLSGRFGGGALCLLLEQAA